MLTEGIIMRAIRSFFRHIRDGFRNLFRNGWMTLAAIFTMTLTLFMVGSLFIVLSNVENITQDIEEGVNIRVHIDIAATEEDEANLREQIEDTAHVSEVTYRTKEQELEDLTATIEEFELVFGDSNPLYNVFVVTLDDNNELASVSETISEYPFALEVTYGELDTENLLRTLETARIIVALIAAVLVVIAISLISNTIKMTIYTRQEEIEIMRLVGAENAYIRAPFAYEGAFIGIIGSVLASLLIFAIYEGAQSAQLEWNAIRILRLTPTFPMLIYIGIGLLVIGIILGVFGARRSIKRFLQI